MRPAAKFHKLWATLLRFCFAECGCLSVEHTVANRSDPREMSLERPSDSNGRGQDTAQQLSENKQTTSAESQTRLDELLSTVKDQLVWEVEKGLDSIKRQVSQQRDISLFQTVMKKQVDQLSRRVETIQSSERKMKIENDKLKDELRLYKEVTAIAKCRQLQSSDAKELRSLICGEGMPATAADVSANSHSDNGKHIMTRKEILYLTEQTNVATSTNIGSVLL